MTIKEPIKEVKITSQSRTSGGSNLETSVFPDPFYCPLTAEIMVDPVVTPDGQSYERSAIEAKYKDEGNNISKLYENRALKQVINETREVSGGDMRYKMMSLRRSMRKSMGKLLEKSMIPSDEHRDLSDAYYCSITFGLMHHPVIDPEGNTFERKAIHQWIAANNNSPITRSPLALVDLYPNKAIEDMLHFEAERPDDQLDQSVRKWKEEEIKEEEDEEEPTTSSPANSSYPTTQAELDERHRRMRNAHIACNVIGLLAMMALIALSVLYGGFFIAILVLGCIFWHRATQQHSSREER